LPHLSREYLAGEAATLQSRQALADNVELVDVGSAAGQLSYGGRLGLQGELGPRAGQERGPPSGHQHEHKVTGLQTPHTAHNGLGRLQAISAKTKNYFLNRVRFAVKQLNTVTG